MKKEREREREKRRETSRIYYTEATRWVIESDEGGRWRGRSHRSHARYVLRATRSFGHVGITLKPELCVRRFSRSPPERTDQPREPASREKWHACTYTYLRDIMDNRRTHSEYKRDSIAIHHEGPRARSFYALILPCGVSVNGRIVRASEHGHAFVAIVHLCRSRYALFRFLPRSSCRKTL